MYSGFLVAFYVALSAWAVVDLPSHPFPAELAEVYFLIIQLIVVGISGEVLATSFDEQKVIRAAIRRGVLTRRRAFVVGLIVGGLGIGAIVATWRVAETVGTSLASMVVAIALICLELIVFPAFGAGYLLGFAKDHGTKEH